MGKPRGAAKKKTENFSREVAPDVHKDKLASNMLSFDRPNYAGVSKNNKNRDRALAKKNKFGKTTKKERVYTDKELGIPKLNTSLDPVGVKVKGKKGKKFVNDTSMQIILAEVMQQSNETQASKIEKARQLEAIREAKRKEIEEKEKQTAQKLENKKKELKKKKRGSKNNEAEVDEQPKPSAKSKKSKKSVSFAV